MITSFFACRPHNMINFAAVCVILLLAGINAAYEDPYVLTDDDANLFYTFQELPRKSPRATSTEAKRRGTSGENFMRFGRSGSEFLDDYDFEYGDFEGARPTRSGINNNDRFIRFGRDKSSFLRFGRNPQRNSNFLRFGRDSESFNRRKREVDLQEEKRGRSSNFVRFGRGNGDNFMRFGRRDQITPTIPSGDSFRQSEILNQLERQRLLRLLAAINTKQGSPERLVQL